MTRPVHAAVAAAAVAVLLTAGCATAPAGDGAGPVPTASGTGTPSLSPVDRLAALAGVRSAEVDGSHVTLAVDSVATGTTRGLVTTVQQVVPGVTRTTLTGPGRAAGSAPDAVTVELDARGLARLHATATAEITVPDPSGGVPQDPLLAADVLAGVPGLDRAAVHAGATDRVTLRVRADADLAPAVLVAQAWSLALPQVTSDEGGTARVGTAPGRSTATARASTAQDADLAACSSGQLDVRLLGSDAAVGHRGLYVSARNVGGTACVVAGYPSYGFTTLGGEPLDVTTRHGASYMAADPGPGRFVVPPGAVVRSAATWDAMSTADDPPTTAVVTVSSVPGADPVRLPVAADTASAAGQQAALAHPVVSYDLLAGGHVTTTAWAPESVAF